MCCADVQKFVHPYLDGEFDDGDRAPMEAHLGECAACRELLAFESSFKATLRARLRKGAAPSHVRQRLASALDRADAQGHGPALPWKRRAVPVVLVLGAAAVAVTLPALLFSRADSRLVKEAIRAHQQNLPVEVSGNAESVRAWMQGKVSVPVKPPRLRDPSAALLGARVGHLRERDAAQIVYRVGQSQLTVHVFDASGLDMLAPHRRVVDNREVFVDGDRGYNVVFYRDRGVGYAFTSDLAADEMVNLVSASFSP
jgi:mycothiol system anti-sigma-R factor